VFSPEPVAATDGSADGQDFVWHGRAWLCLSHLVSGRSATVFVTCAGTRHRLIDRNVAVRNVHAFSVKRLGIAARDRTEVICS
jgi:hypothetical protein